MFSNKEKRTLKITIIILCVITLSLLGYGIIDYFVINNSNGVSFFVEHFLAGICLILIGIIAFILPMIGKKKYSETKSDDMMIIVAGLLILCGLIAMLFSFF